MLQNPRKTLGFKKNMVYKIPPGGGGKPYPASGLSADNIVVLSALNGRLMPENTLTNDHAVIKDQQCTWMTFANLIDKLYK